MRTPELIHRTHQPFLLKDLKFTQQYSHMYYHRLNALRDNLENRALAAWGMKSEDCVRVLNLKDNGKTVIVAGCLYKEMVARPSFLKDYTREIVTNIEVEAEEDGEGAEAVLEGVNKNSETADADESTYVRGTDTIILEDDSGRVALIGGPDHRRVCSGLTIAVLGTVDRDGKFHVQKYMFQGFDTATKPSRHLISSSPSPARPRYLALLSGLTFGTHNSKCVDLLLQFLEGLVGDVASAQRITHVVICGNLVADSIEGARGRLRLDVDDTKPNRERAVANLASADAFLLRLAGTVSVDVMPGHSDPTNIFFPQQPMHPLLLPKSSANSTMKLVTNPYSFSCGAGGAAGATRTDNSLGLDVPIQCLGTSGQNVEDVLRYTQGISDVDAMELMLSARHICPTSPDTLASYPFPKSDPYTLLGNEALPHLFFTGNRPQFASKSCCTGVDGAFVTRIVAVPSFSMTGQFVMVDLSSPTLETVPVKLAAA